jgi:peptide/nickel transport system substrate-binding protein
MKKLLLCLCIILAAIISGSAFAAGDADNKTVVQIVLADASDWDPATVMNPGFYVYAQAYERLVRYNLPGKKPELLPELATSWKKAADNLSWTFQLRKGVKFQDGEPFNAKAVKLCLDRTIKMKKGASFLWSSVKEIQVIDEYTVKFVLKYPAAIDLISGAMMGAIIYSPKAAAKGFKPGVTVGTGPYTVTSYVKSQQAILTRFDDYWGGWKGKHFNRIIKKIVFEPTTRVQLIQSGEADFMLRGIPVDLLAPLRKAKGVEVLQSYGRTNHQIWFNHKKFPTDNPKIREAIWYAVDYEAVQKGINAGLMKPARGPIPETIWGANRDLETGTFNLEKARKLVKESGIPKDKLKMVYSYPSVLKDHEQYGQVLQAALGQIGINLELRGAPQFVHWTKAKKLATAPNLYATMWYPLYLSPNGYLGVPFRTSRGPVVWNVSYYSNPTFDKLFDQATVMEGINRDKAAEIYKKLQKIMVDEKVAIFLGDMKDVIVKRKSLKGLVQNTNINYFFHYDMYRE